MNDVMKKVNDGILFSIVIPVYNVESYIRRSIESVIKQTYQNIEIILVDDGSTDRCPEICDEYAVNDNRISVIHKPNGGLSDARNIGMKASTGDYIIFLDSDDALSLTCCDEISNAILNSDFPDVVVCNTNRIENEQQSLINRYSKCGVFENGVDFLKYCFSEPQMFCMLSPNNVYKRKYLIDNEMYFKEGILHEDERWTPIVLLNAKKVLNTNIVHYNYYIRSGSITTSNKKNKNAVDIIDTVYFLNEEYNKIEDEELKNKFKNYLCSLYLHAMSIGEYSVVRKYINRKLCLRLAKSCKSKIKAGIFFLSPKLYVVLRNRIM